MLDKTQRAAPLCIKCKRPTNFHSIEIVEDKSGDQIMTVFVCKHCDLLTARKTGNTYPKLGRAS